MLSSGTVVGRRRARECPKMGNRLIFAKIEQLKHQHQFYVFLVHDFKKEKNKDLDINLQHSL